MKYITTLVSNVYTTQGLVLYLLTTVMVLFATAVRKDGPSPITSHLNRPEVSSDTSSSTTDSSVDASSCGSVRRRQKKDAMI